MKTLLKVAVYAAGVWLAVELVDGLAFDGTWLALAVIAVVLAIVNATIKPVVKLLSLPVVILSLGLFLLVINAAMLWITIRVSEAFELGLSSTGFGATFLGAIVVSLVTWIGEGLTER